MGLLKCYSRYIAIIGTSMWGCRVDQPLDGEINNAIDEMNEYKRRY